MDQDLNSYCVTSVILDCCSFFKRSMVSVGVVCVVCVRAHGGFGDTSLVHVVCECAGAVYMRSQNGASCVLLFALCHTA